MNWEDDNQNNVTDYLPAQTFADLEIEFEVESSEQDDDES